MFLNGDIGGRDGLGMNNLYLCKWAKGISSVGGRCKVDVLMCGEVSSEL